ncbi:MAG: hypothetical protein ACRED9_14955 [Caulobacteraceae bacterium]
MAEGPTAKEVGSRARPAVWADRNAVARTLSRAFMDDPMISFLLPDERRRAAKSPALFSLLFKLALPHGGCDVTHRCEAVALWRPPRAWRVTPWQLLRSAPALIGVFGFGVRRATAALDYVEERHPHEPHFYLQVLGADPDKQGKGFGGVVIRRQLAAADASGAPAYLESSKETNIPIYQSFGFEVTGEIVIPDGPTLWPMWRRPRSAS